MRGRFTPADRAAEFYRMLPVDVPEGAAALTVTLAYDRAAGVLDLGCFGPDGPRGWSGGARDRFTVAADRATPGYLPGPLPAGTWHVCLGLHRVPAEGLDWEVTVSTAPVAPPAVPALPPVPDRPPRRDLPAPEGMRWLAGDLHSHTVHSDGSLTIDELAGLAAAGGLDFLAVTDHNTVSHHPYLPAAGARAGVVLLPGQEITRDHGHANAFGDIGWVDFRQPADGWLAQVDARGGLMSVNHPLAGDCAWRHPMTDRPPFAEIWHHTWYDRAWGGPLSWWRVWGPSVLPLGGSDFHTPADGRPLGVPTTWVLCPSGAGVDEVLAGMRAGRIAISADREAPVLLRVGDELVALGAAGTYLVDGDERRQVVTGDRQVFPGAPGVHRLEDWRNAVVALAV